MAKLEGRRIRQIWTVGHGFRMALKDMVRVLAKGYWGRGLPLGSREWHVSPESFGVDEPRGSEVARGPEVRFHEGSTRFCEGWVRARKRASHTVGDIT